MEGREQLTALKGKRMSTCSCTLLFDGGIGDEGCDDGGGDDGCSGSGEYRDADEHAAGMVIWTMGVVLGTIATTTGTVATAARGRWPWQGWHPMQASVKQWQR
jgi:hypothetical protein